MDKAEIKYISLLAPLFYLCGTIFLWAKNAHMFKLEQFAYSFVFILAAAFVLYFLVYFLLRIIHTIVPYTKTVQIGMAFCVAVLIGLICNFHLLKPLFYPHHHIAMYAVMIFTFIFLYMFYNENNKDKILRINISLCAAIFLGLIGKYFFLEIIFPSYYYGAICGMILFFILVYCNFVKQLIIFFSFLLLFSFGTYGYNFYSNYKNVQNIIYNLSNSNDEYFVKFKDKPNIYLFWLESFHGIRTLKNVFNVDITSLINYLDKQNFSVRENMYSSSSFTLASMVDVYSLGNIKLIEHGNLDTLEEFRNLIGGSERNIFLNVLKYNDYITNIIIDHPYYFQFKGKFLDFCSLDSWNNFLLTIRPCFEFTKFNYKVRHNYFSNQGTLEEQIEREIDKMQKENTPYFLAWKGGAYHAPSNGSYTYLNREEWIKSGGYKETIENKCSNEIQEIISMILEKDKNALIVILGDHGARTYRGVNPLNCDLITKLHISKADVIDDLYNVFAAVRLPEKYAKFSFDNNNGIYINHENIFVHIFSLLSQNPEYLKLQKIPESRLGKKIQLIKNGEIIKE